MFPIVGEVLLSTFMFLVIAGALSGLVRLRRVFLSFSGCRCSAYGAGSK